MNTVQTKIHNVSRTVSVVFKFMCCLMIIVIVLAIIGIALLMFSGETMQKSFLEAFNITSNNGTIISIVPQNLLLLFFSLLVYSVLMYAIFHDVYSVFKGISMANSPFCKEHIVRIKRVAIMIIALGIVGNFFDSLADIYTIGKVTWNIDVVGIILGIVIYCLALIFDYGCELQKQSNETL